MVSRDIRMSGLLSKEDGSIASACSAFATKSRLVGLELKPLILSARRKSKLNEVRALKRTHHVAANTADLWLLEVEIILASTGQIEPPR